MLSEPGSEADLPDGFWHDDLWRSDDQAFFRGTAAPEFGSRVPGPSDLDGFVSGVAGQPVYFERTPTWRLWRYADRKWWCRLPLLCRLARYVRSEVIDP